jgi:hypothetical protein
MTGLIETLATILIVLCFFSIFSILLTKLFVPGTSLKQLLQKSNATQAERSNENGRDAMLDSGETEENMGDAYKGAAILSFTRNEVKRKRADSIAWGIAKPGMPLFNHDAIQTSEDSFAQISMDKKNSFTIQSNSLVIIKRAGKDPFSNEQHTSMVVLEGELQGKIGSGSTPFNLEVTTPSAVATLKGGTFPGQKTDFKVSSNRDQSSSIVVYKGEAQVVAQGKVVKIPQNTGVIVKPGEVPSALIPLPAAPTQMSPADKGVFSYRDLPPRVHFSWAPPPNADAFHFQIAGDSAFKTILVDKKIPHTEFIHGNLKKGVYFWRVSSVREGCEGRYSNTNSIELLQNLVAPQLQVHFPSGSVEEDHLVLTGMTEPGVHLFVLGNPVKVSETGSFTQEVKIKQGMNLITAEAIDAAGNVTYRSQYVQGGFK